MRDSDIAETVLVENVTLERDAGVIRFRNGTLSFTAPVNGRITLGVFLGQGEFTLTPVLPLEREHLKSVIEKEAVSEPFTRAILHFTDNTHEEIRRSAKPVALEARAREELRDFRRRVRRRPDEPRSFLEALLTSESIENLEAEVLADLYNPKRAGFFSAYIAGAKYNDLRFHVKPRGVLADLPAPEEVGLLNVDPGGGAEGIWYLGHLAGELKQGTASSLEEKRVIDAESYRINTTIAKNDRFTASAEIHFRALADGERVLRFSLLPTLRVSRVSGEDGAEVPFIQEDRKQDGSFYVVLPEPIAKDRTYQLRIEYQGDKVVHKAGGGNFSVGARTSWYPSLNAFTDRSKFDLTFKVPKQYTLVSVGQPLKEWKEEDFACSQWTSDIPLAVAGFNYGSFKKKQITDPVTSYVLDGYATSEMPDYLRMEESMSNASPSRLTEQAIAQAQASIQLFSHWFGKPPFGRLAVTQQPEFSFGQSWPALVYIPLSAFLDPTQRWQLLGTISTSMNEFIQEVVPHEVAHQWWGHAVGWATYHDQWISEGFADFSAGLYLQATERSRDKYLRFLEAARDAILEKNNYGRRANDAGPLWMGLRLNTFKNQRAYSRLVYPKGGYVLHMLRYLMWDPKTGDEPFRKMMQEFVQSHFNQNASTESFQAVAEKHMGQKLDLEGNGRMDWFFRQWVYGTEVPRYKFDYTLAPEQGEQCRLKASLTQSEVGPNFKMLVPIYLDYDGRLIRLGTVGMVGSSTNSSIDVVLPKKPKRVLINANYDVLAHK